MATSDFLPFGTGAGANVVSQADWSALAQRLSGFQSGIAQSAQLNKAWRQSSIMAAVLGQFIADQSGQNAVDDGTTAGLLTNLLAAIRGTVKQEVVLTDTGAANAYTAVNTPPLLALPSTGFTQRISIANANTGASTYAPDGLAAKPIYGLNMAALQGGELPVRGIATLMYLVSPTVNSGNGAWIVLGCTGGAMQIPPATQSGQAVQFGQFAALFGSTGYLRIPTPVKPVFIQWGAVTTSTSGDISFTFPVMFPTAMRSAWATYQNANGSTPVVPALGGFGPSAVGVGAYLASSGARAAAQINVIALGD